LPELVPDANAQLGVESAIAGQAKCKLWCEIDMLRNVILQSCENFERVTTNGAVQGFWFDKLVWEFCFVRFADPLSDGRESVMVCCHF
jgi:hypothetical protein